jgi:hypothetical protein
MMMPIFTIVLCAFAGFLSYGVVGLIGGAVAGWALSMLIGIIATAWSGGLLPRKERKRVALLFYMDHQPMVDSCTMGMTKQQKLRIVEGLIERLFRRATLAAPMTSKSMGMSRAEVEEAARIEATEEKDPGIRQIILPLKDHIFRTMY